MDRCAANIKILNGVAVIYSGAYLNQLRGELIEYQCQELLAGGVRRLVLDFGQTDLINSIGISILLGVIEAVNEAKGELVLSGLNSLNRELFEMLGLLPHVHVEADEASAIQALCGEIEAVAS